MKLEDVKDKIDAYFNSVSADEIVKQFETMGYEFEQINELEEHLSLITDEQFLQEWEVIEELKLEGIDAKEYSDYITYITKNPSKN